jgi:hypothetical protein
MTTNPSSNNNNKEKDFELAVKFLSNPKVFGLPDERKIEFLSRKGIDRQLIERALEHVKFSQNAVDSIVAGGAAKPVADESSSGGGIVGFIWKLVKISSGIAFGAFLFKNILLPYLEDLLRPRGRRGVAANQGRLAADQRRTIDVSPPTVAAASNDQQQLLVKKLDGIVATLQEVVARQESVSQSLAVLAQNQVPIAAAAAAPAPAAGSDRLLSEIADLKALLVAPNRFPPMPTATYVPSSNNKAGGNSRNNKHHQGKATSTSTTTANVADQDGEAEAAKATVESA